MAITIKPTLYRMGRFTGRPCHQTVQDFLIQRVYKILHRTLFFINIQKSCIFIYLFIIPRRNFWKQSIDCFTIRRAKGNTNCFGLILIHPWHIYDFGCFHIIQFSIRTNLITDLSYCGIFIQFQNSHYFSFTRMRTHS